MATTGVDDDPFHDGIMLLIGLVLALVALLTLIGLVVIYYGDSIARPSWDERAVPAAEVE